MRVCVFGCGAIGGLVAARLALSGEEVSVIGRGPHLEAIKREGITLRGPGGRAETAKVRAFAMARGAGVQDLVVLAVKAHGLAGIADDIGHLLGPNTVILTLQNGIPWWYFHKHGGPLDGTRLGSLDPDGRLTRTIDTARLLGCVVYLAATVEAPGVIRHIEGNAFPLGELDGALSARAQAVAAAFTKAGLEASVAADIRAEIWWKALGTLSFNPISALTRATIAEICGFPPTRRLAALMMEEAQSVAASLGVRLAQTIEQRIERAAGIVGAHKTSMLQDVESGRPLEVEALMGAVLEIGQLTGAPAPTLNSVYALTKLLDEKIQSKTL